MKMNSNNSKKLIDELTEAENELYDRQIRLWGLESQKRLRLAKVLISGLNAIGAEVTKNIILSGVHSVKLRDDKIVTEADFCSQFLTAHSSLGLNRAEASVERAQKLNPMVEISADTEPLSAKSSDYFTLFDVVIVSGATNDELQRVDDICRKKGVAFFIGDVWGMFGFSFADLQRHVFIEEIIKHKVVSKPNEKIKVDVVRTTVQRELNFPSYEAITKFDPNCAKFLKRLKRTGASFILLRVLQIFRKKFNRDPSYKSREADIWELERIRDEISNSEYLNNDAFANVFGQISPTSAIIGGILSQEVIKVITKKEAPHCNVFLFDPETCCGFIETIGNDL